MHPVRSRSFRPPRSPVRNRRAKPPDAHRARVGSCSRQAKLRARWIAAALRARGGTEDVAAAVKGRGVALGFQEIVERRTRRGAFEEASLLVEAVDGVELVRLAELRRRDGLLEDADRAVVDAQRDGEWMPVLAAVREREARRVREPAGRAVE